MSDGTVGRSMALEQVAALLKTDTSGSSLHQHLCAIIGKMVDEEPVDALAILETMSRYLKESGFKGAGAPDSKEHLVIDPVTQAAKELWCKEIVALTKAPAAGLPNIGLQLNGMPKALCALDNFMESAAMFKWAGISFGQQATYQIHLSLRGLAASTPRLKKLRFWGKLLGIGDDYFVAEGEMDDVGESEPPVEARGTGANTYTYWVSPGGNAPWTELPLVRPEHIVTARKVRHMLTGDLEADVLTMPWFPGKEKHFLRAQIARISASTCLAVEGFLVEEPAESGILIESPDALANFPPQADLATQEKWQHCQKYLHLNGATSWPDPDSLPDGSEERKVLENLIEGDPKKEMLLPIAQDKPDVEEGGCKDWSIQQYGDKGQYKMGEDTKSYLCTVVRSKRWPGAITVAQGSKFANLYVGYGFKCCRHHKGGALGSGEEELRAIPMASNAYPYSSANEKNPLAPADIMDEPDDFKEEDEPNPAEEPEEPAEEEEVEGEQ